jgi:hypothetical protein
MTYQKMWNDLKAHVGLSYVLNHKTHIKIEDLLKLIETLESKKERGIPRATKYIRTYSDH